MSHAPDEPREAVDGGRSSVVSARPTGLARGFVETPKAVVIALLVLGVALAIGTFMRRGGLGRAALERVQRARAKRGGSRS